MNHPCVAMSSELYCSQLEASLRGCRWLDLPPDVKADLRKEADAIDAALRKGLASRCSTI